MKFKKITFLLVGLSLVAAGSFVSSQINSGSGLKVSDSLLKQFQATRLGNIKLNQAGALTSFTDMEGRMYAAGSKRIVELGEEGQITKTINVDLDKISISPHKSGSLLVGDLKGKALMTLDTKTNKLTPLLKLADVRDLRGENQVPEFNVMDSGDFSSVASDGKQVYVSVAAGFSSAIFRIDPDNKRVTGRAWATAPDPSSMVVHNGSLYVLLGEGRQVRRFTDKLELTHDTIKLPVEESRGLGIRAGELRVLTDKATNVARFKLEGAVLNLNNARMNIDLIRRWDRKIEIKWPIFRIPQRYAVLICGDLAENFWGGCFWNDTVWMYKALLANGYSENHIFVLYGDGVDYASPNPKYQHPTTVTDFPANVTWVNKVFDGLKNGDAANGIPKMRDVDTLFVWTFDHGGGDMNAYLCLRGGTISDTAFATKLNAIAYAQRAIFMQQCRSGGFIDNLQNSKTFISTACRFDQNAQPADTENEMFGGNPYSHGEYNYYITSALDRLTPLGAAVNADSNSDTWVTALEMHNWETSHESRPETPQMNDMGGKGSTVRFKK